MNLTKEYLEIILELCGYSEYGYSDFFMDGDLLKEYMESFGFIYLGSGKDRHTFLSPNRRFVLKFPKHRKGRNANRREHKAWKESLARLVGNSNDVQYAPCRLLLDCVIMMEAMVELYGWAYADYSGRQHLGGAEMPGPDRDQFKELDWWQTWSYSIDCAQIGKKRNGKIVVYDYGDGVC